VRKTCSENDQLLWQYHLAATRLLKREAATEEVLRTGTVADLKLAMALNKEAIRAARLAKKGLEDHQREHGCMNT